MQKFYPYKSLYIFFFLLIFSGRSSGEGTKQIYPPGWGNFMFCVSYDPIRNQFARYGCPVAERLNIEIKHPGEIIYYGYNLGGSTFNSYFRMRDPNDNIVVSQTQFPVAGNGYIN